MFVTVIERGYIDGVQNKFINNIFSDRTSQPGPSTSYNLYTLNLDPTSNGNIFNSDNTFVNCNLYYAPSKENHSTKNYLYYNSGYNSLGAFKQNTSQENNGAYGDPSFKDGTPNDVYDFVPVIVNPAYVINQGTVLSEFDYDFCYPPESRGTSWNRGAFELTSSTFQDEVPGMEKRNSKEANAFLLVQNYPNPFNPSTTISFIVPQDGNVTLKLYDILGNEITQLVNEVKQPGRYEVEFDGSSLSSGIYFYQIQSENYLMTKKMILMK